MNKIRITVLSTEELLSLFESVAEQQFVAAENFNSRHYNRLYRQMEEIVAELKGRDGDQRRELLVLHSHQNDQVRLMSAIHTLAIDYERSRSVLQVLADRGHFPTGMDARGMIRALREGRYIPS